MSKIIFRNVTKTYDKTNTVISGLNLRIEDGSFTILVDRAAVENPRF